MKYIINRCSLINRHPFIHRCISTICFACEKIIKNHKILEHKITEIIHHLFINGYCFMIKDTYQIIEYNHCKITDNYTFQCGSHNSISYEKEQIFIFTLNHLGISPIDGALKHSEILNTIQEYLLAIVKNGGRPSGIFSVSQFTSDEQKARTRDSINTVLSNIGNKGLAAIVEGEYQWQNIGISPRELQILDIHNEQCKMICTYFQIPPILMGFEDRIYNNNYETSRAIFIEDFIEPLVQSIIKII